MGKSQPAYVTPEVLAWARNLDGLTVEEAAKTAAVTVEKLVSWESGGCLPSMPQVKKLAKKYRVPFAYFFLPSPPAKYKRPKNADYRTLSGVAALHGHSTELSFLLRDVMERRDVMVEMYEELGYELIPFSSFVNIDSDDEGYISEYIRNLIGLTKDIQYGFRKPEEAFKYYLRVFERLGILVFQAVDVEPSEMRGVSIYEDIFPIIVLNRKDEVNARIFTMFHELVHIITRTPGICDTMNSHIDKSASQIEKICNSITAKSLVPESILRESPYLLKIKSYGWDDDHIRKIAKDFAVSRDVIIGRLYEIGFIKKNFYLQKLQQYSNEYAAYVKSVKEQNKDGFLPPSVNISTQVGRLYARTVLSAYNQDIITPKIASGYLMGLRVQHFDKVQRWCF